MNFRGFEPVTAYMKNDIRLPFRATDRAAGYDIINNTGNDITISPGTTTLIPTHIKAYMLPDEVLTLYPRSGHGFKCLVRLANTCGIIDADYYNNPDNEGEIFIKLTSPVHSEKILIIKSGDAMCQGIFSKVLHTDNDYETQGGTRVSGLGSTTRQGE